MMSSIPKAVFLAATVVTAAWPAQPVRVDVDNPTGSVTARVVRGDKVQVRHATPERKIRADDTRVTEERKGVITVRCQPSDGARIRLEIDVPYGVELEVTTRSGSIALNGMFSRAKVKMGSGDIRLQVPLAATRLSVDADDAPRQFAGPEGAKLSVSGPLPAGKHRSWQVRDTLPTRQVTYGSIQVQAGAPGRILVIDAPIPKNSPIKLPWQAPATLDRILAGTQLSDTDGSEGTPLSQETPNPSSAAAAEVRFTSDVRMVNLMVAASDRKGGPLENLQAGDFDVVEDGEPQEIAALSSDQVPFNLVLLLDWSSSTERDREAMRQAAKGFVEIARPVDRVAVYALVGNLFVVASPLTNNHRRLMERIDRIPDSPGGSPLYDAMVLAYAEELWQRKGERNALLVISDGVDNQISNPGRGLPSEVQFKKLRQAAAEMSTLIYPIFLDPLSASGAQRPHWSVTSKAQLQQLTKASGGRLFTARSIRDLQPVYPQVANELRSVYSLAYYPKNQNFDGAWRQVRIRVNRPRAVARSRPGYRAR